MSNFSLCPVCERRTEDDFQRLIGGGTAIECHNCGFRKATKDKDQTMVTHWSQ